VSGAAAVRPLPWPGIVAAGAALGVAYTLSPLTIVSLAGLSWLIHRTGRDLTGREQQWYWSLVVTAVVTRLVVIAGLFLLADPAQPYATLFGDEELFKSRAMWVRNIGLGIPISPADMIYSYDPVGRGGYLFFLAYLQALVGFAPYGAHVMNASLYVAGTLVLYRLVRPAYGAVVAIGGLATLLFLPSLFVWSVSMLKEPMYSLVAALELVGAVLIVRAATNGQRALALAGVIAGAALLAGLRTGGALVPAVGVGLGLLIGYVATRPRAFLALAVAVPLVFAIAITQAPVQDRLLSLARQSARYHAGHVLTPGYSYRLIDPRFYVEWTTIHTMPPREAAAFVVKAMGSYFVQPLPWRMSSTSLRAYLPEQVFWYALILLTPLGLVAGFRLSPVLTGMLAAHAAAVIVLVALNSGNIGTLIRHRGLALPYLVWLAALGACELLQRLTPRETSTDKETRHAIS
jgi:hypothetical protein